MKFSRRCFANQYSLSKTLRFELIPQGSTLKNIKKKGFLEYELSSNCQNSKNIMESNLNEFINKFDDLPLTIDFQRTRNSTNVDGDTKRQRFYRHDEIDVVGACLFLRTMNWKFIFGHSKKNDLHKKYEDRYFNRLVIRKDESFVNLLDCL